MQQYPVFIDLAGRSVVVVGGGEIAAQKIPPLLESGAAVVVISPSLTPLLTQLAHEGRLCHVSRLFTETDLADAWLVIAATDDPQVNERVYRAAEQRRILCNTVDYRPFCSFTVPAVVRRGGITVAISTDGGSPALAQKLKGVIADAIGDEYVTLLEILQELRPQVRERMSDPTQRSRVFHQLIASDVLNLLREGKRAEAVQLARQLVEEALAKPPGPP